MYTEDGTELPLPKGVLPRWSMQSNIPTFQLYKPNVNNSLEDDSPLGMSFYANAIDTLKVIDTIYDSYFNEFLLGRKRIFVDATLLNMDFTPGSDGQPKPVFDPNDAVFYNLPGMENDKSKPLVESNMSLRTEQHKQGLQDSLDILSEQCGFGKGYYRFESDSVQTATGVINQNSKLYRKIRKDEILLRRVLVDVAKGLLLLLGQDPLQDLSVIFDDSILEDRSAKIKRSLLEFGQGVIDRVMYFMETRGLSKPAAEALVRELATREKDQSLLSPEQVLRITAPPKEPGSGATSGKPGAEGLEVDDEKSDSERAYHGKQASE
jgi:A118 family predicted phage portal protein